MKATLSKNKRFITVSPKPTKFVPNGLKVWVTRLTVDERKASDLPIMTADIKKGRMRYYLPIDIGIIVNKIQLKRTVR